MLARVCSDGESGAALGMRTVRDEKVLGMRGGEGRAVVSALSVRVWGVLGLRGEREREGRSEVERSVGGKRRCWGCERGGGLFLRCLCAFGGCWV